MIRIAIVQGKHAHAKTADKALKYVQEVQIYLQQLFNLPPEVRPLHQLLICWACSLFTTAVLHAPAMLTYPRQQVSRSDMVLMFFRPTRADRNFADLERTLASHADKMSTTGLSTELHSYDSSCNMIYKRDNIDKADNPSC